MISSWNFLHMFTAPTNYLKYLWPEKCCIFPARGNFPNVNISAIFHDIELKFSTHAHSLPTNYLKYLWPEKCCIFSGQRNFFQCKYLGHLSWYRAEIFYTCSQPTNELFKVPLARKNVAFFSGQRKFSQHKYLGHLSWYRAEIFYTCSQPTNELLVLLSSPYIKQFLCILETLLLLLYCRNCASIVSSDSFKLFKVNTFFGSFKYCHKRHFRL